jgi:hypothetical protein
MVTCEKAFVKLNTNPPKTSTMGYASLSLLGNDNQCQDN